ncbi:hypothetical protein HBI56_047230 [Parastagonospora nodorum]|uniref:Uncharacterized protein n=2 Tax=Phaeosphaeria nodorum (strain SN15 / ATCC MYA-4574 / FGSC 10173) TaxID=321614 RepID=A0A7U2ETT3_PHANO|nr:hypothetical protein SNOG_02048 [Parastagonospora nodorum SN15]KAH3916550.1 hypothetical protein HBH56_060140 [Parastagonospora nodorum]EAT90260.2 hypothetical protein SNOG_02048 [Parastagonospora nodorum SN15]KAH3930895.1 hypothetical protein HBH54_104070 [Parastagonospora nodorum]KAH3954463.1 hypothetical protein HBH53_018750 [Parastagonospora nodorum]KAH3965349.1 hypothetical protein HBH51_152820 [Parastagonospora nodorum]
MVQPYKFESIQFQTNPQFNVVQPYKLETIQFGSIMPPSHKLYDNPGMSLQRLEALRIRFDMPQRKSTACTTTPTATSLSSPTRLPRARPLARRTVSNTTTNPIIIIVMGMTTVNTMGINVRTELQLACATASATSSVVALQSRVVITIRVVMPLVTLLCV